MNPSRTDPLVTSLSEGIGGPVGDHHRPHRWWTPVRVVLAVAFVAAALALVQKAPCVQTEWSDTGVRYGAMCYSDLPYLYTGRGLAEQTWPYSDTDGRYEVMEYPVGISYFAWIASGLTSGVGAGPTDAERAVVAPGDLWGLPGMATEINQFFVINAILLAAALGLAAWLLARAHPRRPWDAMAFAASPMLILTAYINWDLLAVTCTAGALWAWSRGRPVLTGVMIGLGTAVKLYPLFLLGAVLVIALRRRTLPTFAVITATAVLTWAVANTPALITGPREWLHFWTFNSDRGPDLGSLWLLGANLGFPAGPETINLWSLIGFAVACAGVLVLGLKAPATPRIAQLGFLIVAAFLIVNKVYSPQYVLWLLPLAVLARPRWRDLLIWQAGELFYFAAVWLHLGQFTASATTDAPDPAYAVAIAVRVMAELYLVAVVVRDMLRPEHDPARVEAEPGSADQETTTRSKSVAV
ncbi:glycosyltransferase 87 family protein [Alteromonas gracilis]